MWPCGGRFATSMVAALVAATTTGCSGIQSVLDPSGPYAENIEQLWWLFFWICLAVFVVVAAALFLALFRRRSPGGDEPLPERDEPGARRAVIGGAIATAAILIVLLVASVSTSRANQPPPEPEPLHVEVIGKQWWWDFTIHGSGPAQMIRTANELHIPVGRPVRLHLKSMDVIHSFWVPRLHGKMDLVPGRTNELWIQADEPGVFRGQCAELCGIQHAHMGLLVIAEPEEDWQRWRANQLRPAREPQLPLQQLGREVFESGPCAVCHEIRGTLAGGRVAPDLTHLASRRTLAAATIPNRRGHLAGWILDSQHVKPGNHMPPTQLSPEQLEALLAYLESLE